MISQRSPISAFLLCCWAVLVFSCKAPPLAVGTREAPEPGPPPPSTLAPGDRLQVIVYAHPELSSSPELGTTVGPDGHIDVPLAGSVVIGGKTLGEARGAIRESLLPVLREPRISVSVIEYAGRSVYVLGQVNLPGAYPLDRPMVALQGLSLAGGFTPGADHKTIALLRRVGDELDVYYFDGATPGVDGMIALHPDDLIFVRLSGTGTFQEQVLPYIQGIVPPIAALASLILVLDTVDNR